MFRSARLPSRPSFPGGLPWRKLNHVQHVLYSVQYNSVKGAMPKSGEPVHGVARRPGERAGLNADAVLGEGRRLLEEEGADALTMRRLAARLGVAPNSLYS